jgi:hypothetical protein
MAAYTKYVHGHVTPATIAVSNVATVLATLYREIKALWSFKISVTINSLHGVTPQKTSMLSNIAVST